MADLMVRKNSILALINIETLFKILEAKDFNL